MLTCQRFLEVITTDRKLNKNFKFKVRSRRYRDWTPFRAFSNLLAILKTKRTFNDADIMGIVTDDGWQVLASILRVIGEHFIFLDFTHCTVREEIFSEILKLAPNVQKITFQSPQSYFFDENFVPPRLENLRELHLFHNTDFSFAKILSLAKNLHKITTVEDMFQSLVEHIDLSLLKELDLSASKPDDHPDQFRNLIPVSLVCRLQKLRVQGEIESINLASFLATQDLIELELECVSTDYDSMKLILDMKMLRKLTISLKSIEKIDNRIFRLKNASVESLTVETPGYDDWTTQNMLYFVHLFPNLKSLNIGQQCCHRMKPDQFDFKTLKNLKDIEIHLRKVWVLPGDQPQITKLTIISDNTDVRAWKHFMRRTPNMRHLEMVLEKNMEDVMKAGTLVWQKLEKFISPCTYPTVPPYKRAILDALLRNCKNIKELFLMSMAGRKEDYIDLLTEFDYKLSNMNYCILYNKYGQI